MSQHTSPAFPLGQIVATPNVLAHITHDDIIAALKRHVACDWGDVCVEDKLINDRAVLERKRILSAYRAVNGATF